MRTQSGHNISFVYDNKQNPTETTCIIKGADKEVVVESTVRKYHKDAPSKSAARKFALRKALESFPKRQRTEFWETYLNNVKS